MICHLSIPAKHPLRAAKVIAKVIDGQILNFGGVKGAFMIMAPGFGIECWPENATQRHGVGEYEAGKGDPERPWDKTHRTWDYQIDYDSPTPTAFATHVAMTTKLKPQEVVDLGRAEGWRSVYTDREYFKLVELWVDNRFLLEIITEGEDADRYFKLANDVDHMKKMLGVPEGV